jgi:hypothetical protein
MSKSVNAQVRVIRKLCYDLYKADWMRRISVEQISDTIKNYYTECVHIVGNDEPSISYAMSYEDFISETGYDGAIYVCFDEFIESEFKDSVYMKELIGDMELVDGTSVYEMYLQCI